MSEAKPRFLIMQRNCSDALAVLAANSVDIVFTGRVDINPDGSFTMKISAVANGHILIFENMQQVTADDFLGESYASK